MPLLEVVQTRQISASIRLTDTIAAQVDQYAAFIRASADDVVEQALTYVFNKEARFERVSERDLIVSANHKYRPIDVSGTSRWKILGEVLWWISKDEKRPLPGSGSTSS